MVSNFHVLCWIGQRLRKTIQQAPEAAEVKYIALVFAAGPTLAIN